MIGNNKKEKQKEPLLLRTNDPERIVMKTLLLNISYMTYQVLM